MEGIPDDRLKNHSKDTKNAFFITILPQKVRYIGLSSHTPEFVNEVLDRGILDMA